MYRTEKIDGIGRSYDGDSVFRWDVDDDADPTVVAAALREYLPIRLKRERSVARKIRENDKRIKAYEAHPLRARSDAYHADSDRWRWVDEDATPILKPEEISILEAALYPDRDDLPEPVFDCWPSYIRPDPDHVSRIKEAIKLLDAGELEAAIRTAFKGQRDYGPRDLCIVVGNDGGPIGWLERRIRQEKRQAIRV